MHRITSLPLLLAAAVLVLDTDLSGPPFWTILRLSARAVLAVVCYGLGCVLLLAPFPALAASRPEAG